MKKSLILLPLLAACLVGCGESSDPTTSTTDPTSTTTEPVPSGEVVYSFASLTGKGVVFDTTTALAAFSGGVQSGTDIVSAVSEVSTVYDGSATGGAYENTAGLIKFGKSKASGSITLTLSKSISHVVINCFDYYVKTEPYPTASNSVVVNGVSQTCPYAETATPADLTFDLATASSTLTIASANVNAEKGGRFHMFSIKLS